MNTTEFNFVKYDTIHTPQIEVLLKEVEQLDSNPQYLKFDKIKTKYWPHIYQAFPNTQFFVFCDNTLAAVINCVPLYLTKGELNSLSDDGWRWALEKAFTDRDRGNNPNAMCCLSIKTSREFNQQELFQFIIKHLKNSASITHYPVILCPVRPKMKQYYPLQDINNYAQWINNYGLPYDSNIRMHVKNGAVIKKTCNKSLQIEGTVSQWEMWTGFTFQTTGEYTLNRALSTLKVNVELNKAYYNDPHIWMLYNV
ncbi:hypothetical protein [Myroides marinus]|uniref:hypothetical protein n=1 Tax=Myroides marinus TaxID=703342 RepID=UPI002577B45A|nr:hypothetical protein [Myroides marinus]MDM1377962.1 hypothetical protein [Myroides marinus]MDM1385233.1 hypothetical protein [Myroides marinus]MDM1392446.1 hypothetical protein [Myroides marinus]